MCAQHPDHHHPDQPSSWTASLSPAGTLLHLDLILCFLFFFHLHFYTLLFFLFWSHSGGWWVETHSDLLDFLFFLLGVVSTILTNCNVTMDHPPLSLSPPHEQCLACLYRGLHAGDLGKFGARWTGSERSQVGGMTWAYIGEDGTHSYSTLLGCRLLCARQSLGNKRIYSVCV